MIVWLYIDIKADVQEIVWEEKQLCWGHQILVCVEARTPL